MARPPATAPNAKTKAFTVVEGHIITDFDGVRRHGGDTIMLTQAQAKHFQKLNSITLDMGAVFDDDATTTTPKDSAEPASDGEGNADDGDDARPTAPAKRARQL